MRNLIDIAWAAGFLEGEGSFFRMKSGKARVKCTQVDRETLDRLRAMFGGNVNVERTVEAAFRDNPNRKGPIWYWTLDGALGESLMLELLPLMSQRRQRRIREILEKSV